MIGPARRPVGSADAAQRRLHSPRPFRDPRVAIPSHRGWALSLSALLVIVGLSLVPSTWGRWVFGIHAPGPPRAPLESPTPTFLQLLPSGTVHHPAPEPPAFDRFRVELPQPEVVKTQEPPPPTEEDRGEWTFDPTRLHGIARTMNEFEAPVAPTDSLDLAREMLYREMSPGRWPASALVDYSDLAMAREKWEDSDEWFRRVWGERWKAQGDSTRKWDIFDRSVTDVERKGVQ